MVSFVSRLIGYLPSGFTNWILEKRNESPALMRLTGLFASLLRNQEAKIGTGIGKGLFINVGSSAAAYVLGTFKPEVQSFLSANVKVGNVFYDVGANVGFFSLLAARLIGPEGKVISFEPLPDNLLNLRENVKRNQFRNVQILPLALGAANEEEVFQVSERPTWGKLKSVGSEPPDKYLSDIKVSVRRLDDLISEGVIQPPDFVKIDVEGAEVDVVEGAKETLALYGPTLIIELHGTGNLLTQLFAKIGYCALPLKAGFDDVAQAHWNATILAFPSQRIEHIASVRKLLHTSLT
jgi:FkbM family methyltransferase